MLKFKTILHPTDFSSSALAAYEYACALARDHGSKIVTVHVLPTPFASTEQAMEHQTPEFRQKVLDELKQATPAPEGVTVEHYLVDGEPGEVILKMADEVHADLIVLGTHGRTGLWRLLMGSVAEEVLRQAKVPTVTIRQPQPAGATG